MNYLKMLQEIDELVGDDFCYDMEMKSLFKKLNYTQKEAKMMAKIIGEIYSISHIIHCDACANRYKSK